MRKIISFVFFCSFLWLVHAEESNLYRTETWPEKTKRSQIWKGIIKTNGGIEVGAYIVPHPAFNFLKKFKNWNDVVNSTEVAENEKQRFYDYLMDNNSVISFDDLIRFNRSNSEKQLSLSEKSEATKKINSLLSKCTDIVGKIPEDDFLFDKSENPKALITLHGMGPNLDPLIRLDILSTVISKCVHFIYETEEVPGYNIGNFMFGVQLNKRKQEAEGIYEEIYLNIRKAGLLRKMGNAYYPKSFLRSHAEQTGLKDYILESEKNTTQKLNHDELAAEYFGSYNKWLQSLDRFLDLKITQGEINEQ